MAEASFASTFLTTLDARPIKLPADYVEDARKYPGRQPYILPRMPKPMSKPTNLAPGQERSVKVTLKSARNPPLDIKLTSQPLDTSILDLKGQVHAQTRAPVEKLKILHNKKPVPDSKTGLFWQDLKGFLSQRLKDDAEAEKLSTLFKSSWESSKAGP
uniref:Get5 N-terminal domain-containing protein n=1 Tax=Bionectria ochroleuca TaxID=29856 RepID=A0A0B7JYR8_BIOOC